MKIKEHIIGALDTVLFGLLIGLGFFTALELMAVVSMALL